MRLSLLLLLASQAAAAGLTFEDRVRAFAYDPRAPLNLREHGVETVEGIAVRDVSYHSPRGGRVPAYPVVPPGKGRFAGIVFMHWGQGNRSEFLSEALAYTRAGGVSLMIDAPYNRPEFATPIGMGNP